MLTNTRLIFSTIVEIMMVCLAIVNVPWKPCPSSPRFDLAVHSPPEKLANSTTTSKPSPTLSSNISYDDDNLSGGQANVRYFNFASRFLIVKSYNKPVDFENEIAILAAISHCPGIILPTCVIREHRECVFRRALDGDLCELDEGGVDVCGLTYYQMVKLVAQLVRTIGCVHSAGYLHLDIKPENVVREGKKIYLIDFGLARPFHKACRGNGTDRTMSPETLLPCAADMPVTVASDWWSLGVTIYYMFAKYFSIPHWCRICKESFFPYRVLYEEDGIPVRLEWTPMLPSTHFPPDLLDLLFGPCGLLTWRWEKRAWGAGALLQHPFFTNAKALQKWINEREAKIKNELLTAE